MRKKSFFHVDPPHIIFPNTYVTTTSRFTFRIFNDSNQTVHFNFRKYLSLDEENTALEREGIDEPLGSFKVKSFLDFSNKNFSFVPNEGDIWPQRSRQIVAVFNPQDVGSFNTYLSLYINQFRERIQMQLTGTSLPAAAKFSASFVNVGHIPLESIMKYEVSLHNIGGIPVKYHVAPFKTKGICFNITPETSTIPVGSSQKISVELIANQVCQFNETFTFELEGVLMGHPTLTLFGHVLGPTFSVSHNTIEFGEVSCGSINTQLITLKNTSPITFDYQWRVPDDGCFTEKEFNINPPGGTINGYESVQVEVEFMPNGPKHVSNLLVLDILKFADRLKEIPMSAHVIEPNLEVIPESISLGNVCLNSINEVSLNIKNMTNLRTAFEFLPTTDVTQLQAKIVPIHSAQIISGGEQIEYPLTIIPTQLGPINTKFQFLLTGSTKLISVPVYGVTTGPIIEMSNTRIDFGRIQVIKNAKKTIRLTNNSPIIANFYTKFDSKQFKISPEKASIQPGETADLIVEAFLDDPIVFNDEALLQFDDIQPIFIPIKATGIGVPVVPSIDMSDILDVGYIITEHEYIKEFELRNDGVRKCSVVFTCSKPKHIGEHEINFSLNPPQSEILPGESVQFKLKLRSAEPGEFTAKFQCHATVGGTRVVVFQPNVIGSFCHPKLSFSTPNLIFHHIHDFAEEENRGKKASPNLDLLPKQNQTIIVENKSLFNAKFIASVPNPLSLSTKHIELKPDEKIEVDVCFDPSYKIDYLSEIITKKITFDFNGHSRKFTVPVTYEMHFPNIKFDVPSQVNFGFALLNTEKPKVVTMTNNSTLPATYYWSIENPDTSFEVYPIRGILQPGESCKANFSFLATRSEHRETATCHVNGGPDYEFELFGHSSLIEFDMRPNILEFGSVKYGETQSMNVILENKATAPLECEVTISKSAKLDIQFPEPNFVIKPKGKYTLTVTVTPELPGQYKDRLLFRLGGVQDIQVDLTMTAEFEHLVFDAPRLVETDDEKKVREFIAFIKDPTVPRMVKKEEKYIVSEFKLDLGDIILGDAFSKEFLLRSLCKVPFGVRIDDSTIENSGFDLENSVFAFEANESKILKVNFDTNNRVDEQVGEFDYPMTVIFESNFNILVHLVGNILEPRFNLSETSISFGTVVIGRFSTISVQLQNTTTVQCEYEFDCGNACFIATPSSGLLPAASFINVDINFSPTAAIDYVNEMIITFKNNKEPMKLKMTGTGERYTLTFDPPILKLPPINPFSHVSMAEVKMTNTSAHEIEVFSHDFDFKNYYDFQLSQSIHSEFSQSSATGNTEQGMVQKFAVCIIVHGTRLSGKTTISQQLSKRFNCPIISLKELWKDVQSDAGADYVAAIASEISQPEYMNGFIVDGLDGLPELETANEFLTKCIKTKNSFEEIAKNPFAEFDQDGKTAYEKSLSLLLAALDGHHVLMVSLYASDDDYMERKEAIENAEKRAEDLEKRRKRDQMKKMDEEEYAGLTEKEQERSDKYRKASRDRIVKKIVETEQKRIEQEEKEKAKKLKRTSLSRSKSKLIDIPKKESKKSDGKKDSDGKKHHHHHSDGKKHHRHHSEKEDSDTIFSARSDRSEKSTRSEKKSDKNEKAPAKDRKKKKITSVPADPILRECLMFQFTLGILAKLLEYGPCFTPLSPETFSDLSKLSENTKYHANTLYVNTDMDMSLIEKDVSLFLPSLNALKERAFLALIPKMREGKNAFIPSKKFKETHPEHFTIQSDGTLQEQLQSPRKGSGRQSRKGKKRDPLLEDIDLTLFTPRWRLEPGESYTLTIVFSANLVDKYNEVLNFGIDSTAAEIFPLKVEGICDYPAIETNKEKIFSSIVERYTPRVTNSYVKGLDAFHFGQVLVSKEKPQKNSLPTNYATLHFENTSLYQTDLNFTMIESNMKTAWGLDSNSLSIKPNESADFHVSLYPSVAGQYKLVLLVCVKDNPEPLTLTFLAEAATPMFEITPPQMDFEKILIKSSKQMELSLKNIGTIPLTWTVKKYDAISSLFSFSSTEGTVNSKKTEIVTVSFTTAKAVAIKKVCHLEITDVKKTRTFCNQQIQLTGEAFDSSIDLQYPAKMPNLNFGVIKVGQPKQLQCTIKTKGKYASNFSISMPNSALQFVKISQPNGTLSPGDKPLPINFTFTANKVVNLKAAKVGTISVIDTSTGICIYQSVITMDAETVYSKFEVPSEIDFGAVQFATLNTRQLPIKNNGAFPIEFNITMKQEPFVPKVIKGKKTPTKPPPPPKPKMRKGQGLALPVGQFTVVPCTATIKPGETMKVNIEFSSPTAEDHLKTLLLTVNDTDPKEKSPKEIILKSQATMPRIFNSDVEPIFKGTHLCLRNDIARQDITAFLEDEHILHFAPLLLGQKQSIKMFLINPTPITITADVVLKPKTKGGMANFPFEVSPKVVEIKPNQQSELSLSFGPNIQENFIGFFEANVRGCTNPKEKSFKFQCEGVGALPQISLLTKTPRGSNSFSFGRVLVGNSRERTIAIQNDGVIPANAIFHIKHSPGFSIQGNEIEERLLEPGRTFNITVQFSPQKIGKASFEISVTVENNPKQTMNILFSGEGFMEDVIFEGPTDDDNDVSFKDTVVGRRGQCTVMMRNICSDAIRFSFPNHHDFSFQPRVGQIGARGVKEIIVSFFSEKPVKYNGTKLPCNWTKISQEYPGDWDDTHKTIEFKEGKKIVSIAPEPAYKIVAGKQKDLFLRASAFCDNIRYAIETTTLSFAPTMMFERRHIQIKFSNTGGIRFEYSWELERFESLRTEYSKIRPCAFKISPSSGVIEAGQSVMLEVTFAPEEVDDFKAEFGCRIPFLSQMQPPTLSMNAISRRPLCHFNVDLSDYLTRRHPSYIDQPLPDSVKVIEMFSKKVGFKIEKRIEVINPTGMPYEVIWEREGESGAIECLMKRALISSGRKYSFAFEYNPVSAKTTESLWKFSIPVHKVTIFLLVVGRIVPE